MKIIVASENQEKIDGVRACFPDAEIITVDANSYIGDVAFDSGLFVGAFNRIKLGVLKDFGYEHKDWDMIIALQSGYVQKKDKYYITDVCAIQDKNGLLLSNGPMFEISSVLYKAPGKGVRLDELIDGKSKAKGVTTVLEYISNGLLNRTHATYLALTQTLNSGYVNLLRKDFDMSNQIKFTNQNTKTLNNRCCEIVEELKPFNDRENWLPEA
ncbi:MAG: DUF84 family protein [Clostridia bacterium]|nr:DUF84 family protein [Clostridia bacterium]